MFFVYHVKLYEIEGKLTVLKRVYFYKCISKSPKKCYNINIYNDGRNTMNNVQKKQFSSKEIEENIKKINGSMAQEGMPLTKDVKENIKKCLLGESTTEKECQKVIERYKQIYG